MKFYDVDDCVDDIKFVDKGAIYKNLSSLNRNTNV